MKRTFSTAVLVMALSFSFTGASFAADRYGSSSGLKELQTEAQSLLAERQKHMDEITRIEKRLNEVGTQINALTPKPAAVETPKQASVIKDTKASAAKVEAAKVEEAKAEETNVEEKKDVKKGQDWLS